MVALRTEPTDPLTDKPAGYGVNVQVVIVSAGCLLWISHIFPRSRSSPNRMTSIAVAIPTRERQY